MRSEAWGAPGFAPVFPFPGTTARKGTPLVAPARCWEGCWCGFGVCWVAQGGPGGSHSQRRQRCPHAQLAELAPPTPHTPRAPRLSPHAPHALPTLSLTLLGEQILLPQPGGLVSIKARAQLSQGSCAALPGAHASPMSRLDAASALSCCPHGLTPSDIPSTADIASSSCQKTPPAPLQSTLILHKPASQGSLGELKRLCGSPQLWSGSRNCSSAPGGRG